MLMYGNERSQALFILKIYPRARHVSTLMRELHVRMTVMLHKSSGEYRALLLELKACIFDR